MKKTRFLALICSVVLILSACTSCSQDDSNPLNIETTTTQVTASTTAREVPPADENSEKSEDSDSSNEDSSNDNSETDSDESNITTSDAGSETESSQDESSDNVTTTTTSAVTTTTTTSAKITSTTKGVEFTATSKTVYTTGYSALRTSPSDSGTIMRYINPNEAVTVTFASTDGKWYKVSYAGNTGYTTTKGTTSTKPAVTSKTTTTTTAKKTTTTTTKVDEMAFVHAGGTCKFCGKKFSGNDGYTLRTFYGAPSIYDRYVCTNCLNTKCINCGKVCNSNNAVKTHFDYRNSKNAIVPICNIWNCYDCNPEADPQYYTKLARKSEQEMLTLTQQLRTANGRTHFVVDPQLTAWAQTRAKELATKFAHGRPNGDPGIAIITSYSHRGENIAKADGTVSGTALYKSLESSTGHKGTMLNTDYTAIGIGVYYDPNTGYSYTCQLFGGSPYNK